MLTSPQLSEGNLLRLMTWLSPSFPVGGYTYSHGVEYAIETGRVNCVDSLTNWLSGIVRFGAGGTDATFFVEAYKAACEGDMDRLMMATAYAEAMTPTSEMRLEATAQGEAFLKTIMKVWPDDRLIDWKECMGKARRKPTYAICVAVVAALSDVPLKAALTAFLHALVSNLVSAGVRLVPLGQTDGQIAIANLEQTILQAVDAAIDRPFEDIGSAAVMVDWTSAKHETQYTRLFRS